MPDAPQARIDKLERQLRERFEILVKHMQGEDVAEEISRINNYQVPYRRVNSSDVRIAVDDFTTILKEIKASLGKR